jgi:hypothetical protein
VNCWEAEKRLSAAKLKDCERLLEGSTIRAEETIMLTSAPTRKGRYDLSYIVEYIDARNRRLAITQTGNTFVNSFGYFVSIKYPTRVDEIQPCKTYFSTS